MQDFCCHISHEPYGRLKRRPWISRNGKKASFQGVICFWRPSSFEGLKFDFPLEEIEALTKYLHQVVLIRFLNVKCRARHLAGCRRIWLQLHYLGICLNLRCKCFRAKNYLFTGFCISSINRLNSPYVGYLDNGSHGRTKCWTSCPCLFNHTRWAQARPVNLRWKRKLRSEWLVYLNILHPWKRTWHWKIPFFNRKYIFKCWNFHYQISSG